MDKTELVRLRITPDDRALLARAARLSGGCVSSFLRAVALREARVVIAEQQQLEQRSSIRVA